MEQNEKKERLNPEKTENIVFLITSQFPDERGEKEINWPKVLVIECFSSQWIKENGYQDISEYEIYPESHKDEKTDPIYVYIPIIKSK